MAEWFWIGLGLLLVLIAVRVFPQLIAPRCPICGGSLRANDTVEPIAAWSRWHLVWRNFTCTFCMYRQRRIVIQRDAKDKRHEAHTIH